jgi:hypothetical protein
MAGERFSFAQTGAVVLDEVKPSEFVPGRRSTGMDALLLETSEHPTTMRVRDRRLGVVTITASDFDPAQHEPIE